MNNTENAKKKGNKAAVLVLLLLPYILFVAALTLIYAALWDFATENLPLLSVVISSTVSAPSARDYTPVIIKPPESETAVTESETTEAETEEPPETETAPPETEKETETVTAAPEKETEEPKKQDIITKTTKIIVERSMESFPKIRYGDQWATLNIDGWKNRDIPVYCGDTDEILSYGVGMSYSSRFAGQNGKTVIAGHVSSFFYEIEDTEVGDYITVDTVYAHYVYEVKELLMFHYKDNSIMLPTDGTDTLVLYTCYPRYRTLTFKEQRLAVVAEMIEGVRYVW